MKLFGGGKRKKQSAVRAEELFPESGFKPVPGNLEKVETVVIRSGGKKKRSFKKAFMAIGMVAALAVILVICYALWERAPEVNSDGPINLSGDEAGEEDKQSLPVIKLPISEVEPGDELPAPDETEPAEEAELREDEEKDNVRSTDCYTFVIAAFDQIGASTDTILVGKLDTKEATLNVVSIPRDTLVNVSWGIKKINTVMVYEEGDPQGFKNELGSILGFSVDCYAFVDIRAVEQLVDAIGGVYYNVPRNMEYDDPTQDLHIHIPAGYQWLGGKEAVQVLRYRVGNDNTGYPNGDLGRINTQHDFLMSIASQMLSIGNIPNLGKVTEIFEENVTTDLDANNIAFFVREFLKLDEENITFATLPGEGIGIRGGSYYEIDLPAWIEMINEYLNPYSMDISTNNLDILSFDSSNGKTESTTGEKIAFETFYDFSTYTG